MDTTKRTLIKAFTWQVLGILTMTLLSYFYTGSVTTSLSLAFASCAVSFLVFLLHEKLWNRVLWGRR